MLLVEDERGGGGGGAGSEGTATATAPALLLPVFAAAAAVFVFVVLFCRFVNTDKAVDIARRKNLLHIIYIYVVFITSAGGYAEGRNKQTNHHDKHNQPDKQRKPSSAAAPTRRIACCSHPVYSGHPADVARLLAAAIIAATTTRGSPSCSSREVAPCHHTQGQRRSS